MRSTIHTLQWKMAGKIKANGTHVTEPTIDTKLSICMFLVCASKIKDSLISHPKQLIMRFHNQSCTYLLRTKNGNSTAEASQQEAHSVLRPFLTRVTIFFEQVTFDNLYIYIYIHQKKQEPHIDLFKIPVT